jgi:ATP-dependent DNA ligase
MKTERSVSTASMRGRQQQRTHPRWVTPMLATLADEPFSRQGWIFETKLDGERCLAVRSEGDLRLISRNQKLLNSNRSSRAGQQESERPSSKVMYLSKLT